MVRQKLKDDGFGEDNVFLCRGKEVSRLEAFSDCVFAFAVTLIVVSLEVPGTFTELLRSMKGFIGFGICFAILLQVWYSHYLYFRRYGLNDSVTVALNGLLLFIVTFYVFPLKFVFNTLVILLTEGPDATTRAGHLPNGEPAPLILDSQIGTMFVIYGLGFAAVALTFMLMYRRAYKLRQQLELSDAETYLTKAEINRQLLLAGIGGISVLAALLLGKNAGFAGFFYFFIGPVEAYIGIRRRKGLAKIMLD